MNGLAPHCFSVLQHDALPFRLAEAEVWEDEVSLSVLFPGHYKPKTPIQTNI